MSLHLLVSLNDLINEFSGRIQRPNSIDDLRPALAGCMMEFLVEWPTIV
jgi:hypothetical protein